MRNERFARQAGLIDMAKLSALPVTIIGAGAVGSFTALSLAKMGMQHIVVFDDDEVNEHNLPNQFFAIKDLGESKVGALHNQIMEFTQTIILPMAQRYENSGLMPLVITCPDNMETRKKTWEQWKAQVNTQYFIDARMGGEMAQVITIRDKTEESIKFYEERLFEDKESLELPCSERSIIYCVTMISSLICRAVKAMIQEEEAYPKEVVFGMRHMLYQKEI